MEADGIELELAGNLTDTLRIQAGYTHLNLEDENGDDARTFIPRNSLKLLTTWAPAWQPKLDLGLSARWQDEVHFASAFGNIEQDGYAVVGGYARYAFTESKSLALNAGAGWASAAGWLLAFGSTLPWSWVLGSEIGICYAIMVFICLVWLEVAWNMESAKAGTDSSQCPFQNLHRPSGREYGKHGVLFLLAVPGAGILALMLTAALALPLSWTVPVKVAVVIFLFPVLWGAFSAWIGAQDTLLKPSLASVGVLFFSCPLLFA